MSEVCGICDKRTTDKYHHPSCPKLMPTEVSITERLKSIPVYLQAGYDEHYPDGKIKSTHLIPIGIYAREALAEIDKWKEEALEWAKRAGEAVDKFEELENHLIDEGVRAKADCYEAVLNTLGVKSDAIGEIKRLREYEWMYKDLCK